jgi:hypothetical protein
VLFGDWTKRIECFLQAGESFKAEAVDTYLLLPSFWHGMEPNEKRLVVATVPKYPGVAKSNPDLIVAAQADLKDATHGLDPFIIKPPGLKGMDLFKHLRHKSITSPTAKVAPSAFLNVEVTNNQRGILKNYS